MLSLHANWHSYEGPNLNSNRKPFGYRVLGLPPGQEADIVNIHHRWQILRTIDGIAGHWTGQFTSAEGALAGLTEALGKPA
jgi:hypothetical protein